MRRSLAMIVIATLAVALLAGCSSSGGETVELVTIGEGVPTEGRPVFYEFYTDG